MSIIPSKERYVVRELKPEEEKNQSIIAIPNANPEYKQGEVIGVAKYFDDEDKGRHYFSVGDIVLFQNNVGFKVKDGKQDLLILDEVYIYGTIVE